MPHQTLVESLPRQANGRIDVRRAAFQDDADAVLEGVVLAGFKKLAEANRDPRPQRSHRQVLTNIAEKIHYQTGTAWISYHAIAEEEGISERTVQNCIYELKPWGYLASERRACPDQHSGGLTHYTLPIISCSKEQMIAGIEEWCVEMRREIPQPWCKKSTPPAVQNGGNYTSCGAENYTAQGANGSKDYTSCGAITSPAVQNLPELHLLRGTGIKNKNIEEEYTAVDRAFAAYNNAAREHGFSVANKLTDARRRRLEKRLDDIGGLDQFTLALSAIRSDNFLMGKLPPRKLGDEPFKLTLESLLSTDSGLNDVLAKLIDRAMNSKTSAPDDFEAEVARFVETSAGRSMLQSFREREKGMELVRNHVKAQREARAIGIKPNGAHHG